jgi:hypothetical protein
MLNTGLRKEVYMLFVPGWYGGQVNRLAVIVLIINDFIGAASGCVISRYSFEFYSFYGIFVGGNLEIWNNKA